MLMVKFAEAPKVNSGAKVRIFAKVNAPSNRKWTNCDYAWFTKGSTAWNSV